MTDSGFPMEDVARLVQLVDQRGLKEVIVEDGDLRIVVRGADRASIGAPNTAGVHYSDDDLGPDGDAAEADELAAVADGIAVAAPMVGVFYRGTAPGQAPFVDVGDEVEVGQTIGLIEAMKVFSEVPSDHAGIVTAVFAHDGQLVRTGEALVVLRPPA